MIYCSSLSKTLAPGWRIGWIAAGRYSPQVLQARMAGDWAGAPLLEAAASEMLASGDYDRHLRRLKRRIAEGVHAVVAQVKASFPPGTSVNVPAAGFLLWVELPQRVNALEVHRRALALGIGVSPGPLFSPAAEKNIDGGTGLGMAVFAEALDTAQGVDLAFDNYRQDLYLGGKKIFYDRSLCKVVIGADGQYKLTDKLEVGASAVEDQNPYAEFKMGGVNAGYRFGENTMLVAEFARTRSEVNTSSLNQVASQGLKDVVGEVEGDGLGAVLDGAFDLAEW